MTPNVAPKFPASARYRLSRCVARGGMGAVYLGYQKGAAGFERRVAIKRAMGPGADLSLRRAVLEEAKVSSLVRHPNVVSVDDVEEIDDELFLVMEYVDGGSVAQLLAAGAHVTRRVALRIVLDSCEGLGAIHDARDAKGEPLGLVHRDVSPQNILVGSEGVSRISDFGIAKRVTDNTQTTRGLRRGKLGYMSPEYLRKGTSRPSSDMFALGVVMWELLSGKRMFTTVERDLRPDAPAFVPPSLTAIDPEIPAALDAIVARATADDPDARFASMRELADAIVAATTDIASHAEVADLVRGSLSALDAARPDPPVVEEEESSPPTRREPTSAKAKDLAAETKPCPPSPDVRHVAYTMPEMALTVRAAPAKIPANAYPTTRSAAFVGKTTDRDLRERVTYVPPRRRQRLRRKRTLTAVAVTMVVAALTSVAYVSGARPPAPADASAASR